LASTHRQRLRAGIELTFAKRLSPERTRRAIGTVSAPWLDRTSAKVDRELEDAAAADS
jgi:hypothetical protein